MSFHLMSVIAANARLAAMPSFEFNEFGGPSEVT